MITHGDLSYNARDVFGQGTQPLALAEAAADGDVAEIDRLIAAGVNVNAIGKHDITPLWWAHWARNFAGFEELLKKGADPNSRRTERYSIMYLAADLADSRYLAAALKYGGDPNFPDGKTGWPPLLPAVIQSYETNIDLLLAAKANVNWQNAIDGETLPMAAAANADYKLVYKLFQHGADPTLKDSFGHTLAYVIEIRSRHASNNDDPWRAKVIEYMKVKGVIVNDIK